jgi:plasmid stabilization system protein ParE
MVKWTPKSEEDLDQIREHIAKKFNVDLAIETVNEIIDEVESILSKNPLAGALLESNPLFSKLVVQGNSVYYCENPKDHDLYIVYIQARSTDLKGQRLTAEEIVK